MGLYSTKILIVECDHGRIDHRVNKSEISLDVTSCLSLGEAVSEVARAIARDQPYQVVILRISASDDMAVVADARRICAFDPDLDLIVARPVGTDRDALAVAIGASDRLHVVDDGDADIDGDLVRALVHRRQMRRTPAGPAQSTEPTTRTAMIEATLDPSFPSR